MDKHILYLEPCYSENENFIYVNSITQKDDFLNINFCSNSDILTFQLSKNNYEGFLTIVYDFIISIEKIVKNETNIKEKKEFKLNDRDKYHTKEFYLIFIKIEMVDKINEEIRGFIQECLEVKLASIESKEVFASLGL